MNVVHVRPAVAPTSPTSAAVVDEPEFFWDLSTPAYRFVWWGLLTLYVGVELYLVGTIGAYVVVSFVPAFAFYADTFRVMPVKNYPPMLALYSLVAAFYCAHIVQFIYYSVRHRELVFPASLSPQSCPAARGGESPSQRTPGSASKSVAKEPTRNIVQRTFEYLSSTTGLCGVRGVYFESVVMLREVVEIAIQTAQAYVCSRETTKVWVNATFAGLIVLNCYSSPLLHALRKYIPDRGKHRAAVLVVDLALDLVWFIVIPLLIFVPFFATIFTNELVLSRDTFVIEGIMELPAFSVTSYVDLIMKLWPPVAIYFTARKIELLTRRKSLTAGKNAQSRSVVNAQRPTRRSIAPVDALVPVPLVPASTSLLSSATPNSEELVLRTRIERWLRLLLLLWGHAVLAVYVHANFVHSPVCNAGCQLVLRPWLHISRACPCAALEVDCHALGIRGNASEIEDALVAANTNVDRLMNLIVAHCPALHVPPAVGRLRNLYGLALFNCSVVSWHTDAWVTSARHPKLGRVQLIQTFVAEVPPAIAHADLPPRLLEINIVASNLSHLPVDVAQHWSRLNTLLLDHGRFREYPSALSRMPALETVSLYGNALTHIPDDAMVNSTKLAFLHLSENPLTRLPSRLASCEQIVEIWTLSTALEDVRTPQARGSACTDTRINSWSSPVCATADASARAASAPWLQCEEKFYMYNGAKSHAFYPLEAKLIEKQPQ